MDPITPPTTPRKVPKETIRGDGPSRMAGGISTTDASPTDEDEQGHSSFDSSSPSTPTQTTQTNKYSTTSSSSSSYDDDVALTALAEFIKLANAPSPTHLSSWLGTAARRRRLANLVMALLDSLSDSGVQGATKQHVFGNGPSPTSGVPKFDYRSLATISGDAAGTLLRLALDRAYDQEAAPVEVLEAFCGFLLSQPSQELHQGTAKLVAAKITELLGGELQLDSGDSSSSDPLASDTGDDSDSTPLPGSDPETTIAQLTADLALRDSSLSKLTHLLDSRESQLTRLTTELSTLHSLLLQRESEIDELVNKVRELETQEDVLYNKAAIRLLTAEVQKVTAELVLKDKKVEALNSELHVKAGEIGELRGELMSFESKHEEELADLKSQLESAHLVIAAKDSELSMQAVELDLLHDKLANLEASAKEQEQGELDTLREELASKDSELANLRGKLDEARKISDERVAQLESELEDAIANLASKDAQLALQSSELESLQLQLASYQPTSQDSFQEEQSPHDESESSLRSELASLDNDALSLHGDLATISHAAQLAHDSDSSLQSKITQLRTSLQTAELDALREKISQANLERTQLVQDSEHAKQQIAEFSQLLSSKELELSEKQARIEQLSTKLSHSHKTSKNTPEDRQLLSTINTLNQQISLLQSRLVIRETHINHLAHSNASLSSLSRSLQRKLNKLNSTIALYKSEADASRLQTLELKELERSFRSAIRQLKSQVRVAESQAKKAEEGRMYYVGRSEVAEGEVRRLGEEVRALKAREGKRGRGGGFG